VEDLKRCGLFYQGQQIALIRDVIEGGNGNLLEVDLLSECATLGIEVVSAKAKSGDARRVLVPYKEQFVGRVDTEQGTVELKSLWILE
jgi:16S rRNA processing protein RimM